MKRILLSSLLLLLAACSSPPLGPDDSKKAPTPSAVDVTEPLQVPALDQLQDTQERPLKGHYIPVTYAALPGWEQDDMALVWKAFINNCKGLMRPISGGLVLPARAAPVVWQPVCKAAQEAAIDTSDAVAIRDFLEVHLQPWRVADDAGKPAQNTVTGYYEPLITGARQQGPQAQWPLYQTPEDLLTIDLGAVYPELAGKRVRGKLAGKRVIPYDTRAEIAENSDRRPPVIVWADDPVEAFFLQIQGSGRVELPNGKMIRLAYDDHNGHGYRSIGQWLIDQGELSASQASMQNIKRWAQEHPERVQTLLNVNPAMVFFKEEAIIDKTLGPRGAYGIPLIEERAIAVDPDYVPLGSPVFLVSNFPDGKPLRRLTLAQDTGAAIKGAARADYYWGFGTQAGTQAGRMKQAGSMWILWPREAGKPSAR